MNDRSLRRRPGCRTRAAVLLVSLLLQSQAVTAAEPITFKWHTIPMPDGSGAPAVSFIAPEGWRVEGGMQRTPFELRNMFSMTDLLIEAEDGRSVHFYPTLNFRYSDYTQAMPMQAFDGSYFLPPPQSIGQWILDMYRMSPDSTVSDLQIVAEEPMPELTKLLQRMFQLQMQDLARMQHAPGGAASMNVGGTKVVFRYRQGGRQMEETFLVGWHVMVMTTYGQVATANWGVVDMRSLAGPAGSDYINDPALVTIAQSMRFTPAFFEAMHGYYQRLYRRAPPKTVGQLKQNGDSIGDILHDGWKKRSGMTDAGQSREVDMIHERTPYSTPGGDTVYLSSHYQQVYGDGQGRFLLSNDLNWDPRSDSAFNRNEWQMLEPARP